MRNILRKWYVGLLVKVIPQALASRIIRRLEYKVGLDSSSAVTASGEDHVLRLLNHIVDGNELVLFDVGANEGQYASNVLNLLPDGVPYYLHCFEPSTQAFRRMENRLSGEPHVILNNIGLAEKSRTAILYSEKPGSSLSSLSKRNLAQMKMNHGECEEEIQLSTVDHYCSENQIAKINFLKLDVEGHEVDVLQGAADSLRAGKIDAIQFEFGGSNIDTKTYIRDFFNLIEEYEYEVMRIAPNGHFVYMPEYSLSFENFNYANYIVVKKSLGFSRLYAKRLI